MSITDNTTKKMLLLGMLLLTFSLAGCAGHPVVKSSSRTQPCAQIQKKVSPSYLEDFNRANFGLNEGLYKAIILPIGSGYKRVVPSPVQNVIANFFSNLNTIPVIINDILQAKGKFALHSTIRFIINTTVGLGGLFDPSTSLGFGPQPIHEDIGLTLAEWGVPQGAYLVLPVIGPTTLRNSPSFYLNSTYFYPLYYVNNGRVQTGIGAVGAVNTAAENVNQLEMMLNAISPYEFVKSAYLQHRRYLIQTNENKPPSALIYMDQCKIK